MILVNETYPSECIRFRLVLHPSQLRFRVNEIPITEMKKSSEASPPSESLLLKPPRREKYRSPERYQSSFEEPALNALPKDSPKIVSGTLQETGSRERDALDDTIDEAKAASHLVYSFQIRCKLIELIFFASHWIHLNPQLTNSLLMPLTSKPHAQRMSQVGRSGKQIPERANP